MSNRKKIKNLSDTEALIQKFEKRVKYHRHQLVETKKFHRGVEQEILEKIRLEMIQLKALKK